MSGARAALFFGLSTLCVACASTKAEAPPIAAKAEAPPSVKPWRTLTSPRLGMSIEVPSGSTLGTEKGGLAEDGSNPMASMVVSLGEDRTLFVARTDLWDHSVARLERGFRKEVRDKFVTIDREGDSDLSDLPANFIEGDAESERVNLWMVARGASFYTVVVSGPKGDETGAIADRVIGSFRVVPTPQIRLSAAKTYAAAVPSIAFDLPTPMPDPPGSTARVYGLDADSADAFVVIEMPLGEGALDQGQDALFERSLRGIASSGAQIDGVRPIEVAGFPGREIRKQNDGMYSRLRMVLTPDKLFLAGVTSRDKAMIDSPDSQLFLDSFRPVP